MRWRPLAFIVSLLVALATLLLLLIIGLVVFRDPVVNSVPVRTEITELLHRFTGRDVLLKGDIDIDDFPWITVVMGPGTFGNPPGFVGPPLLAWQEIRLRVHYSSLYEDSPRIDRIVIGGLVADLRRDAAGRDNWSDIGPITPLGPPTAELLIPLIEVNGGSIRYTDDAVAAAPFATAEKVELSLRDVTRGVGSSEGQHWRAAAAELDLDAAVSRIAGPIGLRAQDIDLWLADEAAASARPSGPQPFTAKSLQLRYGVLRATIEDLELQPQRVAATARLEPVALDALLRLAGFKPQFRSSDKLLQLRSLDARLIYDAGSLHVDGMALQVDDTRIRGTVRFGDPIRIDLTADAIDLDRYPAASGDLTPSTRQTSLVFPGSLLRELPLDGRIRFDRIRTGSATLRGATLRLESRPKGASPPR
jgi:AsmA protein